MKKMLGLVALCVIGFAVAACAQVPAAPAPAAAEAPAVAAVAAPAAINVLLKNDSGSSVDVALVDQYGGNFTATIDAGTSQNQTLLAQSEIKIAETTVHVVSPGDEGQEIVIAGP
jgi:hypothetical protein